MELTELSNGQKVDSRIYPYLQEMFDAARKDGIYPVVRERMEIDASKRLVYRGEKEVNITFTEFEILYLLASSIGISRKTISVMSENDIASWEGGTDSETVNGTEEKQITN